MWFSGQHWTNGWQTFQDMSLVSVGQHVGSALPFSALLPHSEEEDGYRVCKFLSGYSE